MASDKNELIGSILNLLGDHPEEKISSLLGSLPDREPDKRDGGVNPDALSLLSGLGDGGGSTGAPDVAMLLKLKKAMDRAGREQDDRTALLRSLKPFLSERRKGFYDQAMKALTLSRFASMAKELDLF